MRKFRIDASQKIQASPVDFGNLQNFRDSSPADIKAEIDKHKADLAAYLDAKMGAVCNQLNADIQKIIQEYVYTVGSDNIAQLDKFLSCFDYNLNITVDSNILSGFEYRAMATSEILWIAPELSERSQADFMDNFCCSIDYDGGFINDAKDLYFWWSESDTFITIWAYTLIHRKDLLEQLTVDTVVDIFEQLIYEFAEFADTQASKFLEDAVQKFIGMDNGEF